MAKPNCKQAGRPTASQKTLSPAAKALPKNADARLPVRDCAERLLLLPLLLLLLLLWLLPLLPLLSLPL
jgi:hypothetical protein